MDKALGRFQHRVARRITRRHPRRWGEWIWEYPTLAVDMDESGFEEIGVYTTKRKNMATQYIATQQIMDLC